ncbi:alkaline phosphatase [Empedobacter brevis NBRC 14943 = ATCC 43319]|uniref:Alkaline phosphatase n=1 Tax=Empedobacter brevis NBRC 14943 = ATCC 43319 TaxID=1218108 RepID=A0A511NDD9_9FLAO|nr:BREX-1 system phosphatase PglZ type A [Empedobacter brevis]GEM50825.1 alkaline phosphatase [Empedobacter brevis NBRC 14943 = ATCC 43319]
MNKLEETLLQLFQKHRIIVWYDAEKEYEDEIQQANLPSIEIIRVDGNEFTVKYRVLQVEPQQQFLLYIPTVRPENEDNWLLDIELSHQLFHTDQESMLLQELDLPIQYKEWAKTRTAYFKNKERKKKFLELAEKTDTPEVLDLKLLQIIFGTLTTSTDDFIQSYVKAFVEEKEAQLTKDLERYQLKSVFWNLVAEQYQYIHDEPTIYDFVLEVFYANASFIENRKKISRNAMVLYQKWKDISSFKPVLDILADRIASDINVVDKIDETSSEALLFDDVFREVDQRVIRDLRDLILNQSITAETFEKISKDREASRWYKEYQDFYETLRYASRLQDFLQSVAIPSFSSYEDGFAFYTKEGYKADMYYRKFMFHYRLTNNNGFRILYEEVHKWYSNSWMFKLSENWQSLINKTQEWYVGDQSIQNFFKRNVKRRYIDRNTKVAVIISDAFRYEIGQELMERINKENRFDATLDFQIANLPSYTQLGMASLLPHQEIEIKEDGSALINGLSTLGLEPRKKVLNTIGGVRAEAISAEDVSTYKTKSEQAIRLVQDHDVIYIYHNRIDKIGDDKTSEVKVIEAVEDEIKFIIGLVRSLTNFNLNHILVTADHGFIYQDQELNEMDFVQDTFEGDAFKVNRRFILGKGIKGNSALTSYHSDQLKLKGDFDVLIPNGSNRMRVRGAGSRFVHGGHTLQEVVIPIVAISKKRTDTIKTVSIDVLNKGNNRITTNIHTVKLYQEEPVTANVRERNVKVYFVNRVDGSDELISDVFTYNFDFTSERAEDREKVIQLTIMSKIYRSNNVYLKVDTDVEGSNTWVNLLELHYNLNISMENDFDF